MIRICQFGAGRIGAIHAGNIAAAGGQLVYVVDVDAAAAASLAARYGARVTDAGTALADPGIDAVIIASSTDTHADLLERAARAGKTIFCEKPIDLSLERARRCAETVAETGARVVLGFNRRFDPSFAALHAALRSGRIGKVELVQITSRDPGPPPISYVRVSGGLFRDMMIHDFDMARFLLGEDPVSVFASAACLIDPEIGAAGDVDSAMVVLRTASGRLCQISNSRRAVYGYDQRIEVHGAGGMLEARNHRPTSVVAATQAGVVADPPLHFFLERYAEAYRLEMRHFLDVCRGATTPAVGIADGLWALALAEAALESHRTGHAVAV
jgi:myo-inositol 2-dehydrogenase/D-chiro-inositol 1-dehydrogenase